MAEPFVGEIRMFAGNFAPRGWALCNGQLLAVSKNEALFSLLGTFYGGDARTTFGLPDLRGRAAVHPGQGPARAKAVPKLSFAQVDANRDGEVTKAEYVRAFAKLDTNEDGKLSAEDGQSQRAGSSVVRLGRKGPVLAYKQDADGPGTLSLNFIISLLGVYPSRS